MKIGHHDLERRILLVAEIGNNHEGDVELAERLVGLAAEAGADAVKFQTFRAEALVSRRDRGRFERLRGFELRPDDFRRLAEAARREGVLFLSTPLDLESARLVGGIAAAVKIASGDVTFAPLLAAAAGTGRPILLSTGSADLETVGRAVEVIAAHRSGPGPAPLALLHCLCAYPAPIEQANLAAIAALRRAFGVPVGWSDHTLGLEACLLAAAAGARIVEKHFTIAHDHSAFRDHALSATPAELAELARRLREVETILGDGVKVAQPCEGDLAVAARRSVVAAADLPAGTLVEPKHLTWLRPGGGIEPGGEAVLLGRRLRRAVEAGAILHAEMLGD